MSEACFYLFRDLFDLPTIYFTLLSLSTVFTQKMLFDKQKFRTSSIFIYIFHNLYLYVLPHLFVCSTTFICILVDAVEKKISRLIAGFLGSQSKVIYFICMHLLFYSSHYLLLINFRYSNK
jgi:hypothetical protein